MRFWPAVILGVAVLAVACGSSDAEPRAPTGGGLQLENCELPGAADARCGTYRVFENRAAKTGRTIDLNVVVLPARAKNKKPDPLFFLHGGPGAPATMMAPIFARSGLRQHRDIVLVDQRGTGGSNPLHCDLGGIAPLMALLTKMDFDFVPCRAGFDADLRHYTTTIAVDDLEDVRRALGAKQINLYGASYGTRVAFEYARRYPERIRSVVMRGVAPPSLSIPVAYAEDSQRALDLTLGACRSDRRCREAFPDIEAELAAVLRRLSDNPATVEMQDPYSGKQTEVTVTRELFAAAIHYSLYSTATTVGLPHQIHQAYEGKHNELVGSMVGFAQAMGSMIHLGMMLSVICTEDEPFFTVDEAHRRARSSYLGNLGALQLKHQCENWPRGKLADDFKQAVRSDVPMLLLSGEADPVTPPRYAAQAMKYLPNALHLEMPGQSHADMEPGCVPAIVRRFIEQGSAKQLDTGCLAELGRPPFRLR